MSDSARPNLGTTSRKVDHAACQQQKCDESDGGGHDDPTGAQPARLAISSALTFTKPVRGL